LEFGPEEDFQEFFHRSILGGLLRGEELHSIQEMILAARANRASLLRHEELPLLLAIAQNIPHLRPLGQSIASAVSPSGELLDDASPDLRALRQESRLAYHRLNQVMERNLRRFQRQEVVQEPLITERNGRLVLMIKTDLRSRVSGIVHDVSDSGATVFIEPMLAIEHGNKWRESRRAEEREEERILRHLSGLVGESGPGLLLMLDQVGRLDLDVAKARYSRSLNATEPWVGGPQEADRESVGREIIDRPAAEREIRLTGARHPLLAGEVVPVNVRLGGGQRIMLITGPNAGGKTVTLKTVGLLALMAHAGLHVPAGQAVFPVLDGVYADIGDQQSIEQSLSTFSSHIRNILSIMNRATSNSLVLVDELGTSTDPEEGSALAKAILGHFESMGLLMVATTHHRGVANYVQEQPAMVNASVDLHPQTLEPTFRVTQGLPGRSYALTIASRLGLPASVVENARSGLSPVELATENMLGELQEERNLVEDLRRDAEEALVRAREQESQLNAQLASVESSKLELVEQARRELQEQTADMLRQIQDAERTLKATVRDPASGTEATGRALLQEQRARLSQVRRELDSPRWEPIEVSRPEWYADINAGQRVYIRGIPRPVEVVTPPNEHGQVEVLLGTMRASLPVYQLERLAGEQLAKAIPGVHVSRLSRKSTGNEVDLRGFRVDEALDKVEGLLNDAVLDAVGEVRIIHGKGTGALRRAVREYLEDHPLVTSSEQPEGPGGDGVTVAHLRS
jgi:DNA mismatch repair protein MutS2